MQQWLVKIHDHNLPGPPRDEETTGTEKQIVDKYTAIYPDVYFEEQGNGQILVFRSQKEAGKAANNIGSVHKL